MPLGGSMHPEDDYWRIKSLFNNSVNGGKGFSMKDQIEIIKKEREYLLQCEIDELNKY